MGLALNELGIADQNADGVVNYLDATGLGLMTLGYNSNAGHIPYVAFLANAWRAQPTVHVPFGRPAPNPPPSHEPVSPSI